ncbi:MAG: aldo/keto reductase [Hyphomicrobiaceae bacterium]
MKERNLGRSGLKVSVVGLGCNNFGARIDLEASRAVVHKALDCGVTLFDTADVYGNRGGSEEALGRILGPHRKDIVLATKFALDMDDAGVRKGASRRYIMSAVEDSLRRLGTDYIDLYQQHRPDPCTPAEETMRALDDLVSQGKVRYVGCSNLASWQVVDALWQSQVAHFVPFVSAQDEYSLLERGIERELIPALAAKELGLLPYFPLASGILTGKYRGGARPSGTRLTTEQRLGGRWLTRQRLETADRLADFAESRGHSLLELAMSWLACQPVVSSVIAGATRPEQVELNVKAAGWILSQEELAEVDRITA